ncbi:MULTISPECIES: amidase [Rhodococcus]|uniref:amidase n=1 Tax=Rhodococcus TaxID=1827 RepID=UPI000AD53901|nr:MULTISPECIES: amidase [Rhodococcus]MCE4263175.1 amidase [Rhodococcus globerulus]NRI69547.1 amidase [Rhodococcus sp. MS16]QXW04207.1 amidase [Rhodococcus globerulus]ROZ49203.1 amidase [Rhodococcus sp. WS3]
MNTGISRRGFLGAATALGVAGATAVGAAVQPAAATPIRSASRHSQLPAPSTIDATDPALLSATEAASLLQEGILHPRELLDACLTRSHEYDGGIGSWIRIYPEVAYAAAEKAAQRLSTAGRTSDGEAPPLVCGLPIALKDMFAVSGLPVTASSRVLEGNIAAGDSTVWRRLSDAGMVLMGHAHCDEFAIGVATAQVGNPWNAEYSPGGSSGGSAAVLAARFSPLATGTDTGGSLRLPASATGITSVKPTFGRCSTYGTIPLNWTRDHTGPMARSAADASLLLSYMAGVDVNDPTTSAGPPVPADGYPLAAQGGQSPLAGRRFGIPRKGVDKLPASLGTLFAAFTDTVVALGGTLVDVTMPTYPTGLLTGDMAEAGHYHQQFSDRIGLYKPERALFVGQALASMAVPVADYMTLAHNRLRYQHDYNRMLSEQNLDAILVPGASVDGSKRSEVAGIALFDGVTADVAWANYTGAPVVTTPAGRSKETGLPFGVQLGGRMWDEAGLIQIALELQAAQPFWQEAPPLTQNARQIPTSVIAQPGPGPDPTNTQNVGFSFRFVPTSS